MQWDGDYLEEYKVHPEARAVDARGNARDIGTTMFAVQMVHDAAVNAETLQLIDGMRRAPIIDHGRFQSFVDVVVDIPADRLEELARRPDVVSIQPYFVPELHGERQGQIMAGNLSGNEPSGPGYLAWLASKGLTQAQFDASGFVVDVVDSGVDNGTIAPTHFGLYR